MSKSEIQELLSDIFHASQKILSYTSGMGKEGFSKNAQTASAVVRNFEIIAEAAEKVPDEFKIVRREVEWRRMASFHSRIISGSKINYELIWRIKEENIPELIEFIQQSIEDLKKLPY